jgi:nucleotide-binding universal stress UspA family protein
MKKILVPCDFSKPAINAYQLALDIAAHSHGTIHLVNVIELPVLHDSVIMPVLNFEEQLLKELREGAEAEFKKLIAEYKTDRVKVISSVQFGIPSMMLLNYAKKNAVDLIVMGSHGATGLKEFFIGSNAEKMVRRSPVPVLVVKEFHKGPIKNIVFPNTLDTEHQEDLVMKVKALQDFFKAHLHIVWINTPANFMSDTITRERLNSFAKRFMLKDYTVSIFNHANEENDIMHFSRLINGDMIAMGTNGRKGVSHFLNGSLAEDVVNHGERLIWTYSLKNETIEA